jgi:hypothetical protein
MEFTAVASALLRRWYVVLVGLALTAGLVYVAQGAVPPTYTATGSVLLLPPGASVADGSNPLLQLGGLEQPASLVVAYLAGDDARQAFAEQHPEATYDIVLDPLSRGPLILITMEDPDQDDVMSALNTVLATLPDALSRLQDQVAAPADSRVTSMPLSVDTQPTTDRGDTLRALIAAAGAGLVLTLVGAVAIDSLAVRRRERRAAAAAAAGSEPSAETPAVPAAVAREHEPEATERPETIRHIESRDLDRSEDLYGSQWPPRAPDESSLDDQSRVAPRA